MKKIVLLFVLCSIALAGCSSEDRPQPQQKAEIVQPKLVDHYYSLKDGQEYGYEQGISAEDANRGQVASNLLMVKYAGKIDGKYQAYIKDGGTIGVFECANPCEFIKAITFYQNQHIKTERIRATEGSLGWSIMADAINGKLEQYKADKSGKKFTVWFDEKRGAILSPADNPLP